MRRALLALALLALFPATSAATAPPCGPDVRVFEDGSRWYACGPASARPTLLWVDNAVDGAIRVFGHSGDTVLLAGSFVSEGGDEPVVGWFDTRTSRARVEQLYSGGTVQDIVVAADGGIGVAAGGRVSYFAPGAHRERVLSTAAPGPLAFGHGTLHFGGRSVPLTGEPVTCTSGTTLVASGGARVFEVWRGSVDVLAACARDATAPRELAVSDRAWTLREWAGRAFLAGANGVGVLDGGGVRFVAAPFFVEDVAIGETGPVVFAGGGRIAREESLFGWEWVAAAGGRVVKDSLAISGFDVTWRTERGAAAAVLRPVEPPGCGSGATQIARRGLRVFELVRYGGGKALLACPPGATVPLVLLTAEGRPRWSVGELAREHGRYALLVHAKGAEAHDVISFDAHSTRAGKLYGLRGKIRDVELAPDGRVAIATQRRVSVLPLAGPGELGVDRTVGEPRNGVRAGSLRFKGERVVWLRSRSR